jgi:hypothetical protein
MKQAQPNFEALKVIFYNSFVNETDAAMLISMERLHGNGIAPYYKRKEQFNKDFNKWLDLIDIRQAGKMISTLKEHGKSVPAWMSQGNYFIDYNDRGALDLIKATNN